MQTKRRTKRLYWDANCFIALFNREPTTKPQYLTALETAYVEMTEGKIWIATSDVFRTEVFAERMPDEALPLWDNLNGCPYFEIATIRTPHWVQARQLILGCQEAGQRLESPDALHIVMGSVVRAEAIWTTDAALVTKSKNGLLGSVPVVFPRVDEPRLPFPPSAGNV